MGALAAAVWFGVGYTILRSVQRKDPRPTRPRSAHIDTTMEELQQDRSWSTGRVLGAVAVGVCFLQAAGHSVEVLANAYEYGAARGRGSYSRPPPRCMCCGSQIRAKVDATKDWIDD